MARVGGLPVDGLAAIGRGPVTGASPPGACWSCSGSVNDPSRGVLRWCRRVYRRVRSRAGSRTRLPGPAAYFPRSCQDLPSVTTDGAYTISTSCMSRDRPRAQRSHRLAQRANQVLRPVGDVRGSVQDLLQRARGPHRIRVPRGRTGDGAAMPQFVPRPGASVGARQRGAEHQRVARRPRSPSPISPPFFMPPSATTGTYRPVSARYWSRAAATSRSRSPAGRRCPATSRVVQAAPGPTPRRSPRRPAP